MTSSALSVTLPVPAANNIPFAGAPAAQASAQFHEPTPCVVSVQALIGAASLATLPGVAPEALGAHLPAQPGALVDQVTTLKTPRAIDMGYVRVDYGGGSTAPNTRFFDLRSGSYQLPPCTYAQVSVRRFCYTALAAAAGSIGPINVAAAIAEGSMGGGGASALATDFWKYAAAYSGMIAWCLGLPGARGKSLSWFPGTGVYPQDTVIQGTAHPLFVDMNTPEVFPSSSGYDQTPPGFFNSGGGWLITGADDAGFSCVQGIDF